MVYWEMNVQETPNRQIIITAGKSKYENMGSHGQGWRNTDSKEKAHKYMTEQERSEHFINLAGIELSIEEWKVEWLSIKKWNGQVTFYC